MKPPYFVLHLKSDLTLEDCIDFLNAVTEKGEKRFRGLFVALPFSRLEQMTQAFPESGISFGASEMMGCEPGDFTASIAGKSVLDAGGSFVLIGTKDERSKNISEAALLAKLREARQAGLRTILALSKVEQLDLFKEEGLHDQKLPQLIIYEPSFNDFKAYLPSEDELSQLYQSVWQALETAMESNAKAYRLIAGLPADLVGFSALVENMPFAGGFFIKSGIHPHSVHQEVVKLFHVHCQENNGDEMAEPKTMKRIKKS